MPSARQASAQDVQACAQSGEFACGMIGDRHGAIDMGRIVLEHGADEDLRLVGAVIAAQEAEIGFLRDWLAERRE